MEIPLNVYMFVYVKYQTKNLTFSTLDKCNNIRKWRWSRTKAGWISCPTRSTIKSFKRDDMASAQIELNEIKLNKHKNKIYCRI